MEMNNGAQRRNGIISTAREEGRAEGKEEGRREGVIEVFERNVSNLMRHTGWSREQAERILLSGEDSTMRGTPGAQDMDLGNSQCT